MGVDTPGILRSPATQLVNDHLGCSRLSKPGSKGVSQAMPGKTFLLGVLVFGFICLLFVGIEFCMIYGFEFSYGEFRKRKVIEGGLVESR